jgi:hypothetical protein
MAQVAAASIALRDATPESLVVVETIDGPRFPNGVILDVPSTSSAERPVRCGPSRPCKLDWALPLSARRWWDPVCAVGGLDPCLVKVMTAGLDPLLLPAEPAASIGWGPGLTPAGDDVVVGMLIGFHAAGAREQAQELAEACAEGETVPLSRSLLDHAAVGEAVRPVLDVMAALAGRGDLDITVGVLRRFGATSGPHILEGLRRALSEVAPLIEQHRELVA